MKTASDLLNQFRITLWQHRDGNQTTTCPQCSASRKKKRDPCLSVKVDALGVQFFCHHCGWKGGMFFDERARESQGPGLVRKPGHLGRARGSYGDLQRSSSSRWR